MSNAWNQIVSYSNFLLRLSASYYPVIILIIGISVIIISFIVRTLQVKSTKTDTNPNTNDERFSVNEDKSGKTVYGITAPPGKTNGKMPTFLLAPYCLFGLGILTIFAITIFAQ